MVSMAEAEATRGVPTLPGRYYYDAALFAREQERLFATQWVCVGRAERLSAPGAYFLAQVAGESLIVLRDRAGVVRAFYNVCRHRGARLCVAEEGALRATIQCRYHAWTYALDGQLVGAPNMREDPDFEPAGYGLAPVHLREWEGLLFVCLAAQPGELLQQGDEMAHPRIARYNLAALKVARTIVYDVRANWKIIVANYEECAHCALVHPELSARVPTFKEGLATGGLDDGADYAHGVEALTMPATASRPPLPGLLPEDYHRYYGLTVHPNLFINFNPDHVGIVTMTPLEAGSTRLTAEWLFDPAVMAQPGFDPSDVIDFSDLVKRQDWDVCELSQLGVASRGFRDGGVYGPHERHIRAYDDEVLALLGESG